MYVPRARYQTTVARWEGGHSAGGTDTDPPLESIMKRGKESCHFLLQMRVPPSL